MHTIHGWKYVNARTTHNNIFEEKKRNMDKITSNQHKNETYIDTGKSVVQWYDSTNTHAYLY